MISTKRKVPNMRLAVSCVLASGLILLGLTLHGSARNIDRLGGQSQKKPASASSAPSPSPNGLGELLASALAKSREEQEKTLNERGPQFSPSFDANHFSMTAFCRAGALIVVEYELEDGAEATLAVTTFSDKGLHIFEHHLEGSTIGTRTSLGSGPVLDVGGFSGRVNTRSIKRDVITLPDRFGAELQPGAIAIHARIGKKKAYFQLHGMSVGVSPDRFRKTGSRPLSSLFQPVAFLSEDSFIDGGLGLPQDSIWGIKVLPENIRAAQRPGSDYGFMPNDTFGSWAADFRSIKLTIKNNRENVKTTLVRRDQFDEMVTPGNWVHKEWDGLNDRHKPSAGRHQLMIRAWWSKANGGAACVAIADQVITVEK